MSPATTPAAARAATGADAARAAAVARLELSRLRLRHLLLASNGSSADPAGRRPPDHLLDSLRSIPLFDMLLDTVSGWWSRHPARLIATLVAASVASTLQPVTQRHPRWTLFGALTVGGLVLWARPWRFAPLRQAICAGFVPQLVSRVLSHLPIDGWMTLAESLLQTAGAAPTRAPAATGRHPVHPPFPPGSGPARASPLH